MRTASTGSPLHDFTSSTRRVQVDEMRPLVARLGSSSSARSQELAAIELHDLVRESNGADSHEAAIVRAGAIEPLVALLRGGGERAQRAAAGALSYLATDHQAAIAQAGAIEPLVALVRGGSAEAQGAAASALGNLAGDNADNRVAIARAGAIAPLVALVGINAHFLFSPTYYRV